MCLLRHETRDDADRVLYSRAPWRCRAISTSRKRIQFVSDRLVEQILEGRKTASVAELGALELPEDEYNSALVCGELYDVYDSHLVPRCTIRIVAMEVCRWDAIPERLWRGETNQDADEFRADHVDYFGDPKDDFEFVAYYFERVDR